MDEFWKEYFEGRAVNPWITYGALLTAAERPLALDTDANDIELSYSSSEASLSPVQENFRGRKLRARVRCGDSVLLVPAHKPGLTVAGLTLDVQQRALRQCPQFWRHYMSRIGHMPDDLRLFRVGVVAPALRPNRRVSDAVSDMEMLTLMREIDRCDPGKAESRATRHLAVCSSPACVLAVIVSVLACAVAGITGVVPLCSLHALSGLRALMRTWSFLPPSPVQHQLWYHRSCALLDAGDPANAALLMERALKVEPRSSIYWATLARARQRLGKAGHTPAAKAFEMALHLDPLHEDARYFYAQVLEEQGQLREARTQLSLLLAAQPSRTDARWTLGSVLEKEGRVAEAVKSYSMLTEAESGNSKSWLALGRTLHASGSVSDAIAALRQALALDPIDGHAVQALGHSFETAGQHELALAQYKVAATLRVRDPAPLISMGNLMIAGGDAAKAIQSFKAAVFLDPANTDTINHLVKVATAYDRLEEAEHFARQALRAAPLHADSWRILVQVLQKQGRNMDAAQERLKAASLELDEIW